MQSIPSPNSPTVSVSPPIIATLQPKPSKLRQLWNKICALASKIFSCFTCYGKVSLLFSQREITLLRDDDKRSSSTSALSPLSLKNVTQQKKLADTVNPPSTKEIIIQEPAYITYDEPLESLREFIRDFACSTIDILNEKHVDKQIETIQNSAPSLPIKSTAKLLIEIGDKAAKPVFKKFSQQKTQVIDPALRKIFKTLLKEDQSLIREFLTHHLENKILSKPDLHEPPSAEYIKGVATWISTSAIPKPPLSDFIPKDEKLNPSTLKFLINEGEQFYKAQQNLERQTLYLSMESKILQQFKDLPKLPKQNLSKDYITPVLDWLLRSDMTTPFTELFLPLERYREELIDQVFELAVSFLVERKIDQYAHLLEKTMQRRLGEIVNHTAHINASRFADFFSERLAELIESMPFTQTFDSTIHRVVLAQIDGCIAAEKALDAESALLEKAKQAVKIIPSNDKEREIKAKAEKHLASVAKHGSEEAYLEYILLDEFSSQPGFNPHIKQIIQQQIALKRQGRDPNLAKKAGEKALLTTLSEDLLLLMLPTRKKVSPEGHIEDVDPFVELWNRLYFPEELYDLVQHIEELGHEFITPETTALFGKIKQPLIEIAKSMFKTIVQDLLKKHLVVLLQKGLENLTLPANLDDLHAESLLPAINRKLVQLFINQELTNNIKNFAPFFHILLSQGYEKREANIRLIEKELVKFSKEKLHQFDGKKFYTIEKNNPNELTQLTYEDLSGVEWLQLAHPLIVHSEKLLLQAKINDSLIDPAKITIPEIIDILSKSFNESSTKNDPVYGDIIMKMIFKLGGWTSERLISFFIKDSISTSITGSLEDIRGSHAFLISTITQSLKDTFLDRQRLEFLLSDQIAPLPQFTPQKLAHQIDLTSKITHDILMRMADQKGTVTRFAIKSMITDSPKEIHKLISTIYHKLFKNEMINQNLIVKLCDELFQSLVISADKIRTAENLAVNQQLVQ